jgi:hypothetical protein
MARDTERFVLINVPYNFMFACKARRPRVATRTAAASRG